MSDRLVFLSLRTRSEGEHEGRSQLLVSLSFKVRSLTLPYSGLLNKLSPSHTLRISVSEAHRSASRRTSSRRTARRLISHLAADDLWSQRPRHDKVCEPCTFNYRSEGSVDISMQHPSLLLLIALQ